MITSDAEQTALTLKKLTRNLSKSKFQLFCGPELTQSLFQVVNACFFLFSAGYAHACPAGPDSVAPMGIHVIVQPQ